MPSIEECYTKRVLELWRCYYSIQRNPNIKLEDKLAAKRCLLEDLADLARLGSLGQTNH